MTTLAETLFTLAKQFDLETNYAHLSWEQLDKARQYKYQRIVKELMRMEMQRLPDRVNEVRLTVPGGGRSFRPADYQQEPQSMSFSFGCTRPQGPCRFGTVIN